MSSQNVQLYEGLKPCMPSDLRITNEIMHIWEKKWKGEMGQYLGLGSLDVWVCVRMWVCAHLRWKVWLSCHTRVRTVHYLSRTCPCVPMSEMYSEELCPVPVCPSAEPLPPALKPFPVFEEKVKQVETGLSGCDYCPSSDPTFAYSLPQSWARLCSHGEDIKEKYSEVDTAVWLQPGAITRDSYWESSSWMYPNSGEENEKRNIEIWHILDSVLIQKWHVVWTQYVRHCYDTWHLLS